MTVGTWSKFITPYSRREVLINAPTTGGVYALWVRLNTGRWECFYIGKAENLQDRLREHLGSDEENECIKDNLKYRCGFNWLEISTASERAGAEKFLYDKMKPDCNQIDPGGAPLRIPLPPTPTAP